MKSESTAVGVGTRLRAHLGWFFFVAASCAQADCGPAKFPWHNPTAPFDLQKFRDQVAYLDGVSTNTEGMAWDLVRCLLGEQGVTLSHEVLIAETGVAREVYVYRDAKRRVLAQDNSKKAPRQLKLQVNPPPKVVEAVEAVDTRATAPKRAPAQVANAAGPSLRETSAWLTQEDIEYGSDVLGYGRAVEFRSNCRFYSEYLNKDTYSWDSFDASGRHIVGVGDNGTGITLTTTEWEGDLMVPFRRTDKVIKGIRHWAKLCGAELPDSDLFK